MIEIWKRTELEKLMRSHGLRFSKGLGQNFLTDRNILEKIVAGAELSADDHVVEIGSGLGALTVFLAQEAGRVTAVEIDRRLIPALREATEGLANIDIVNEDFLKFEFSSPATGSADAAEKPSVTTRHAEGPDMPTVIAGSGDAPDMPTVTTGSADAPDMPTITTGSGDAATRQSTKVVGNLPYNITTPIIAKLFEQEPSRNTAPPADGTERRPQPHPSTGHTAPPSDCSHVVPVPAPGKPRPSLAVFMMQKEVAERLLSPPGKKAYGAISVLVQYYTDAELLFEVSREVFVPKPNVDSAVVRFRPKDLSADDAETAARMFRLVRAGFDMRRKTLRNSLARAGFPEADLLSALESAGIDPGRRAETLSSRDFYTLAAAL